MRRNGVDAPSHPLDSSCDQNAATTWIQGKRGSGTIGSTTRCGTYPLETRKTDILELQTILDTTVSDCGGGTTPCIDPILGPTAPGPYWSTTILARNTAGAWYISFGTGLISDNARGAGFAVRAVRGGFCPTPGRC